MTVETFIGILIISATATSIGIEIIKKLFDTFKWKYDSIIVAVIVAFIIGVAEVGIYAFRVNMPLNYVTLFYALCMGIMNVIGSTVGYDIVKKFIYAFVGKKVE